MPVGRQSTQGLRVRLTTDSAREGSPSTRAREWARYTDRRSIGDVRC